MRSKRLFYIIATMLIFILIGIVAIFNADFFKVLYFVGFSKSGVVRHFDANGRTSGMVKIYIKGNLYKQAHYKNGSPKGWVMGYYPGGILESKTFFKNGVEDGIEYTYYRDGKIKLKESFKNGLVDGPKILFYENGQIKQKTFRKENKVQGLEYGYYQDGNLNYTRNWVDDKPYGDFYYYYDSYNKKVKIYHAFDISGRKFYLCHYDEKGQVLRDTGYTFSGVTYTKVNNGSPEVLNNHQKYRFVKDLYVTVAHPPQYLTEIAILINNKECKNLLFPNSDDNTVEVKDAFKNEGIYHIVIHGVFKKGSDYIQRSDYEFSIAKESGNTPK